MYAFQNQWPLKAIDIVITKTLIPISITIKEDEIKINRTYANALYLKKRYDKKHTPI